MTVHRYDESKNTVNPSLTPDATDLGNQPEPGSRGKRDKRMVENTEYDAFTRRILTAYGRRVAAGDVEALRTLTGLVQAVDLAVYQAVRGLHEFGYSWSEIADRLGISRQAVQMRFGDRHDAGALDARLVKAGLGVSVDTLVTVFADHHPGQPAVSRCPACGYVYPEGVTDCPTNAAVRPVLYRRRTENHRAVDRLTSIQFADLHNRKSARSNRAAAARAAARPAPSPDRDTQRQTSLLDLIAEASSAANSSSSVSDAGNGMTGKEPVR